VVIRGVTIEEAAFWKKIASYMFPPRSKYLEGRSRWFTIRGAIRV